MSARTTNDSIIMQLMIGGTSICLLRESDVWLAADYHFPTVYSCRVPMTGMSSALALPTPEPSTVRLAIIRSGIELFGIEDTRKHVFPTIRSMSMYIRPPEHVAFSNHLLRASKDVERSHKTRSGSRIMYREIAHATGVMTVYICIPKEMANVYTQLLAAIGYCRGKQPSAGEILATAW
jgi:hypothetical protein